MEKSALRYAADGEYGLLIFSIPAELAVSHAETLSFAFSICKRQGGFTLAVPLHAFDSDALIDQMQREDDGLLGPSKSFVRPLLSEDEQGTVGEVGKECRFLVIDFSDAALPLLQEYDPVLHDSDEVVVFDLDYPSALPSSADLASDVRAWAANENVGRAAFYSAREEQEEPPPPVPKQSAPAVTKRAAPKRPSNVMIMEQVNQLAEAVKALSEQQARMLASPGGQPAVSPTATPVPDQVVGGGLSLQAPAVPTVSGSLGLAATPKPPPKSDPIAKAAMLIGPPPKTKSTAVPVVLPKAGAELVEDEPSSWKLASSSQDPVLQAFAQQSSALTALVAHFTGSDPMSDLSGSQGLGHSSATRGAQRREKMQIDLSSGQSNFYWQVVQQMHRRLHPSRPMPSTESEAAEAGVSMLTYLERFGGYRQYREYGLVQWILGHAFDAILQGNVTKAKEHLALLICSIEQATLDNGSWDIAFLLSLSEDPPLQVFQDRMTMIHSQGRPFSPLAPSPWCAVVLSFLKELEVLQNKKAEAKPKVRAKTDSVSTADSQVASPKRKPRYPKKPKAAAAADQ